MAQVGSIKIDDRKLQEAMKAKAEGATYIGAGDNLLDFRSAASFIDEDQTAKRATIKIKNTTGDDITIRMTDLIENPAKSVLLQEGEHEGLTVKSSPRSYDTLRAYLQTNATRVRSIKFNVSEIDQLDEPMRFRQESPWQTHTEEERIPSNYQSQDTNNPKMSEVNDIDSWMLSNQSTILYTVRSQREVTLSILFGASIDTAKALAKKASNAQDTVATAFARKNHA